MFHRILLAVAAAVLLPGVAVAQTVSLDALARSVEQETSPGHGGPSPEIVTIRPEFLAALRAELRDGGREVSIFTQLQGGQLEIVEVAGDMRYRAPAGCARCAGRSPIEIHTHPYENPISIIDLSIAEGGRRPVLVVTHDGLYLAIWSSDLAERGGVSRSTRIHRYSLFANRLECPARPPADGWSARTRMGRNVEAVMRAAAPAFGVRLYRLRDGAFRRMASMAATDSVFDWRAPVARSEFNLHERTLLRTAQAMQIGTAAGDGALFDPTILSAAWTDLWTRPPQVESEARAVLTDGLGLSYRLLSAQALGWFEPLPTTFYADDVGDTTRQSVRFTSVQYAADCSAVLVLEGAQAFAPDGVRYARGWRRSLDFTGPENAGWTPIDATDLPTDHHVPWGSSSEVD